MTRSEAVAYMTEILAELIDEWIDATQDATPRTAEASEELGWVGRDLGRLMAVAAISVWAASADVQDYLKTEGHLKE